MHARHESKLEAPEADITDYIGEVDASEKGGKIPQVRDGRGEQLGAEIIQMRPREPK